MNYSRAFSYVFEDKNWLSKILIAGLISLIPIIGQIYLYGWMIEIIRRVKGGRTDILPTTHFSYFLTLGLKMFVVTLIYSIPVLIISGILQLLTSSAGNADESVFTIVFAGIGCIGGLLGLVLQIAVSLLTTYGLIKLAETDQIKACLDFNDAFQCIKNNIGTFIIVELLSIVAVLIQSAGLIICVGIIFTVPYGVAISGHLVGQLWDNLNTYSKPERSVRGSKTDHVDDIIEEAPFTMVQDIEKKVAAKMLLSSQFPKKLLKPKLRPQNRLQKNPKRKSLLKNLLLQMKPPKNLSPKKKQKKILLTNRMMICLHSNKTQI